MNKVFIDIHVIQSVPPSCVNRDDTGSPKTAVYGGVRRARISSQCWKKSMRCYFISEFDSSELSYRSTKIVQLIADEIVGIEPSVSREDAIAKAISILGVAGIKIKNKSSPKKEIQEPETGALFFISKKQAHNLAELALQNSDDKKEVQEALNKDKGIEISLFGRMVADNPKFNVDASVQVAHSISTHRVDNEYDYFTAMDDLSSDTEPGAGMIGVVEYNSSTLYRYSTIAVHLLSENLGDKNAVAKSIATYVKAFLLSMPTGHQTTFANKTIPYAAIIEVRNDQPVNLVGAFEKPVQSNKVNGGYNEESVARIIEYKNEVESSFVSKPIKTWLLGKGLDSIGIVSDLDSTLKDMELYLSNQEL